jgi:comEA protein
MQLKRVGIGAFVVLMLAASLAQAAGQKDDRQAAKATSSTPVNLNTATMSQLESLPGIGPKTAERIIEYREKVGGFKKIEELMNVQGVGEKSFLKLKDLITATAPKSRESAGSSKR